LKVRVSG